MQQYNNMVLEVLNNGSIRTDRTGVGTISVFTTHSKYDLRLGFPLLQSKKIDLKNIFHELTWFLRGETNINTLKSPQLWSPWADPSGECGPIYGHQWRNFLGEDQIVNLLKGLKEDPHSRRHVVSAWNPKDLDSMVLPPCHTLFQCFIEGDYLDLSLYQRSADVAIGVPYNIASYSLLLMLIARECGKTPRYFIHTTGDTHIYLNHVDKLKKQIAREPKQLPTVKIVSSSNLFELIDKDDFSDILLEGYDPHPFIKYDLAV